MAKSDRKTYRSDALAVAHEIAEDLFAVSVIDKTTKRRFDVACLTPVDKMEASEIRRIREGAAMSQSVFALALNVSVSLVSKWERGDKRPSGPSLKLLTIVSKKGIETIL